MKVLAISGSPCKGGNTDILIDKTLEAAKGKSYRIKKIRLNDLDIKPCQGCGECLKTGICQIKDDMALLYNALDNSDIVIVGSPIYFGNVSSQTKIMVDRMQCFWSRKYLLKKSMAYLKRKGAFISCGGFKKKEFFECASKVLDIFFKVQDIEFSGKLFVGGVDKPGDVLQHKDALREAYEMGERLAES